MHTAGHLGAVQVTVQNINDVKRLSQYFVKSKGGLPGGAVVKNPPANAGDTGSSPGPGRSHMPQSN